TRQRGYRALEYAPWKSGMIVGLLAFLICAVLVGAFGSAGPALPGHDNRTTHTRQFAISLPELLLLSQHATLEQVEAASGSPPGRARSSRLPGLLETPDGYWVERGYCDGLTRRSSIVVAVGSGPLGPRYPMDK